MATETAVTEPTTDIMPLIDHISDTVPLATEDTRRSADGKAIPMKKANGKMLSPDTISLTTQG